MPVPILADGSTWFLLVLPLGFAFPDRAELAPWDWREPAFAQRRWHHPLFPGQSKCVGKTLQQLAQERNTDLVSAAIEVPSFPVIGLLVDL